MALAHVAGRCEVLVVVHHCLAGAGASKASDVAAGHHHLVVVKVVLVPRELTTDTEALAYLRGRK